MQSIYRFREAKVALFLQAWEQGLGSVELEPLTLSTNFRSQGGLVDWFNAAFPHILPARGRRRLRRRSLFARHAAPRSAARRRGDLASRFDRARTKPRRIVDLVRNAAAPRRSSCATASALAEIVPALKAAGIRFRAIEIEQLGEKQVVQDLYALTRALLHLGDRIAWLSLLRAPWLAPSARQAARDRRGEKPLQDHLGADQGRPLPRRLHPHPRPRRRQPRARQPARARRRRLARARRPRLRRDKTDLEDAERYLDELESLEEPGPLPTSPPRATPSTRLYALPDRRRHRRRPADHDHPQGQGPRVRHRHRPRPGLGSRRRRHGSACSSTSDWFRSPPDKGEASVRAGGYCSPPSKPPAQKPTRPTATSATSNADAEDVESSRLLYVAATRAENRLHLMACLGCDKEGELKKPIARSLLSRAWSVARRPSAPKRGGCIRRTGRARTVAISRPSAHGLAHSSPPLPRPVRWTSASGRARGKEIEFSWAGKRPGTSAP